MDELWQRYRTFWVPVLYGVGAFLAGLIVVNIVTADPEAGRSQNDARVRTIKNYTAPSPPQVEGARKNRDLLAKEVTRKASLLDQRHGEAEDVVEAFVTQALRAAHLRGSLPADPARFDDDAAAKDQATARYEQRRTEFVQILRLQDPNVGFSRVRADVVTELSVRANRADVDVAPQAESFGLEGITTVDRAELPRRLANLALIATMVDVAIREGVRSIDAVQILQPEVRFAAQGPEAFVAEWPVKLDVTGTPEAVRSILNVLTDPARPTPLGSCILKQTSKRDGLVRAELRAYSIRVRPEVPLGLEGE